MSRLIIEEWMGFICLVVFIGSVVTLVVSVLCDEASGPLARWWKDRFCLVDRHQSVSVRRCAERLTARRRANRFEAAQILGDLGDRTAVPALLRAAERYQKDVPFLLIVVHSLVQLGDARALPTLRQLATGHHYELMQAAQEAIAAIEPQTALLRASTAPSSETEALLRPAIGNAAVVSHELLRPGHSREETVR